MLKMVDGTGIIGVDMVCPLGGAVSPPQPPNYDKVEMEGVWSLMLPNSLKAPLERLELLGNSVQGENPSPDNPQEIKSAGRKSKNLLIENISVFTVQDNIAYIPLPEGHETKLYTMLIQKKPGENDDVGFTCGFYDKSNMTATYSASCLQAGNLVTGNGIVNSKIGVNHFVCFSPADSRFFDIYNVMYAEGKETTLDYEPYGYLLDVKVTGKNLFDITKYDKYDDTWTNTTYTTKKLKLKPNTTYTMSCKRLVDKPKQYVFFLVEEGIASGRGIYVQVTPDLSVNYFISKGTFTTNDTGEITLSYYVDCPKEQYWFTEVIGDIQIEEGNKATPYEPYTEQTLTLTSDRPLTKWDRLVEQGGQIGWLYGSKIYVVTGNEVFESRDGYNIESYTNRFFILNDLLKENDALKPLAYMKCLRNVQYVYSPNIFEEGFETNINQFHIKLSNDRVGILASDDHAVRTAKFSGYMKKIHKNGNPIEILYATTDTVFFPLSQEEQTQLRNLHSYNGTTNIMVDSGEVECGIKLTYRKEI